MGDILSPGSEAAWRNKDKPHYVYEFWDKKGHCLYVGCTVQPGGRISQHATKIWWRYVDRIVAKVYPNKETARFAELRLLRELDPLHNLQGTEKSLGPRG